MRAGSRDDAAWWESAVIYEIALISAAASRPGWAATAAPPDQFDALFVEMMSRHHRGQSGCPTGCDVAVA